jgi:hypothetical protein
MRCFTVEPGSPNSVFAFSVPLPVFTMLLYIYPELYSQNSNVLMPNLTRIALMNNFRPSRPFQSIRLSSTVTLLPGRNISQNLVIT